MGDWLRFTQPGMIACLGAVIVILVVMIIITSLVRKSEMEESKKIIKWVRWISILIIILLLIGFAWQVLHALSINNVDRSIIDRSGIDFDRFETPTPTK